MIFKSKRNQLIAGISILIALSVMIGVGLAVKEHLGSAINGSNLTKWTLKDEAGTAHSLNELRGKWVILHFWASWCAPCLEETPKWLDLAKKFEGRPLQWLAISQDKNWSDARRVLEPSVLSKAMISLLDESGKVADQLGTYQLPETYLINPDSKIEFKWVGSQDWSLPEAKAFLEQKIK